MSELAGLTDPQIASEEKSSLISKDETRIELAPPQNSRRKSSWICFYVRYAIEAALIITMITLYIITLEGCNESESICLGRLTDDFTQKLCICIGISGGLYSLIIFGFWISIVSVYAFFISLLSIIFLCFIYDTGNDFKSHGAYNRVALFIIIALVSFMFTILYILYKIIRRWPIASPIAIICFFVGLFFLIQFKIKNLIENSCYNWEKGFKDTRIEFSVESKCNLYPPEICYYEIFDGVFDLSKFFFESCDNVGRNKFSLLAPYIQDKSTKIVGYPRTENWKFTPNSTDENYQSNVLNNVINMEDPKISQEIKNRIETTVDFYKSPPEVTISLKIDEKLISSRKKLLTNDVMAPNVLHLFIDSLSRVNARRKLPMFYKWLEDHYYINQLSNNTTSIGFESFQFLKHHGVGAYTLFNMVPTSFGVFHIYSTGKYFITEYKKKGYITGEAIGYCGRELFGIQSGTMEQYEWDTFDHEFDSLYCDPNYTPWGNPFSLLYGLNSIRMRCLYDKSAEYYMFEYAKQFFEAYQSQPKFFRIGLYEAHEGTNEVIKYYDKEITQFFIDFERLGYLNNTIVFIQSDHGLAMMGPYSAFGLDDYKKEKVLPSFFLLVPTNIKNYPEIRQNLKYNEQSMTTPFTIYNSLIAILGINKDFYSPMDRNYDIFTTKIPKYINCYYFLDFTYYSGGRDFLCRCNEKVTVF